MRKKFKPRNLKLTVVGDKCVGKTSLLKTYSKGIFPTGEYKSTVFPFISDEDYVYSKSISYAGIPVLLAMWDRVYNRLDDDLIRSLQYNQIRSPTSRTEVHLKKLALNNYTCGKDKWNRTDVFLLCFSVVDKSSFVNAIEVWKPEILKHCPKAPCILVGLKKDLRCSRSFSKNNVVTKSMGRDMAEKIGAVAYTECSSKRKEGVREVFVTAVQTAMRSPPPKPKKKKLSNICGAKLLRFIKLL